ncbi:hypothetical protein BMT71_23085, partial [Escherichia coli]
GTVCVVGKIRDLILQLSKSSIYSTKPLLSRKTDLIQNFILFICVITIYQIDYWHLNDHLF